MRSKGSRFTLGVWGWRCVRSMLSNRPQPSATDRNRLQPFATVRIRLMDVPIGSSTGAVIFGGFTCHVASFRVAGVALRDMWTCLVTCWKSLCVGGRNTFVTFSEHVRHSLWQAQHFGRVQLHFSWQAQHFRRVVLRVCQKSHWHGRAKW